MRIGSGLPAGLANGLANGLPNWLANGLSNGLANIPVNNLPDLDSSPEPEKRESKAIEHCVTLKRFELSRLNEMELEESRTWLVELFLTLSHGVIRV